MHVQIVYAGTSGTAYPMQTYITERRSSNNEQLWYLQDYSSMTV